MARRWSSLRSRSPWRWRRPARGRGLGGVLHRPPPRPTRRGARHAAGPGKTASACARSCAAQAAPRHPRQPAAGDRPAGGGHRRGRPADRLALGGERRGRGPHVRQPRRGAGLGARAAGGGRAARSTWAACRSTCAGTPRPSPIAAQRLRPGANVDYAARFLRDLYRQTGDWMTAAGSYHSFTPERREIYLAALKPQRGGGQRADRRLPRRSPPAPPAGRHRAAAHASRRAATGGAIWSAALRRGRSGAAALDLFDAATCSRCCPPSAGVLSRHERERPPSGRASACGLGMRTATSASPSA